MTHLKRIFSCLILLSIAICSSVSYSYSLSKKPILSCEEKLLIKEDIFRGTLNTFSTYQGGLLLIVKSEASDGDLRILLKELGLTLFETNKCSDSENAYFLPGISEAFGQMILQSVKERKIEIVLEKFLYPQDFPSYLAHECKDQKPCTEILSYLPVEVRCDMAYSRMKGHFPDQEKFFKVCKEKRPSDLACVFLTKPSKQDRETCLSQFQK